MYLMLLIGEGDKSVNGAICILSSNLHKTTNSFCPQEATLSELGGETEERRSRCGNQINSMKTMVNTIFKVMMNHLTACNVSGTA